MDPTLVSEQPTGFYGWILENGQIIAFLAQIIYWLGMLLLIGYAVWQYKRWVNYQLGTGKSGKLRAADEAPKGAKKAKGVSVEEFVE